MNYELSHRINFQLRRVLIWPGRATYWLGRLLILGRWTNLDDRYGTDFEFTEFIVTIVRIIFGLTSLCYGVAFGTIYPIGIGLVMSLPLFMVIIYILGAGVIPSYPALNGRCLVDWINDKVVALDQRMSATSTQTYLPPAYSNAESLLRGSKPEVTGIELLRPTVEPTETALLLQAVEVSAETH